MLPLVGAENPIGVEKMEKTKGPPFLVLRRKQNDCGKYDSKSHKDMWNTSESDFWVANIFVE